MNSTQTKYWTAAGLLAACLLAGAVMTFLLVPYLRPVPAQPIPWGRSVVAPKDGGATLERGGLARALEPNTSLVAGDTVATDYASIQLATSDGTLVRLAPLSRVRLGPDASQRNSFRLLVGAVRVETDGHSQLLQVGVPWGWVQVPSNQVTVADITIEQLYARIGTLQLERAGNGSQIGPVQKMNAEGTISALDATDPVVLEEMIFPVRVRRVSTRARTLDIKLTSSGSTRFARPGSISQVPATPQALQADDALMTHHDAASVTLGSWGHLQLNPNTTMRLTHAVDDNDDDSAVWNLDTGGLRFQLDTKAGSRLSLELRAGPSLASLQPGYRNATGRAQRVGSRLQVALQTGDLMVGERRIEAGHLITIDGNRVEVEPLVTQPVSARDRRATIIHAAKSAPAVELRWKRDIQNANEYLVELALDPQFKQTRLAETVHGDRFIVESLSAGQSWYWRVDHGPASKVTVLPQPPDSCAHCLTSDPVSSETHRVEVEYDEVMPSLGFTWQQQSDASYYLFRLWRVSHPSQPVAVAHVPEPQVSISSGSIEAGEYFWKIGTYDDEGRLIRTSDIFELAVRSGSRAPINITAPAMFSTSEQKSIVTRGLVHPGATLSCNGEKVSVDAEGYFEQEVALRAGRNFLRYSVTESGADHVFLREVMREPQTK